MRVGRKKENAATLLAWRSRQVQRGAARAAVLGVNDGLVSVLCLVLGVAGAGASAHTVILAGFAGLIAGAVSMAAGEWISVRAQVELFTGILNDIRQLMQSNRAIIVEQLAHTLAEKGQSGQMAQKSAAEIATNEHNLTEAYARQVMGFNPDELGSPWVAAVSSFALFTLGALAPLLPWFFASGNTAIISSIVFTALGGLVVGGYISYSGGRSVIAGALRQLGIIILASAVTYGVGYIFGVSIS